MKRLFNTESAILSIAFIAMLSLCPAEGMAETSLTADNLEYLQSQRKYVAIGNVVIKKESAIYKADKAVYDQNTEDMQLLGNVVIEDKDYVMNTERAAFNAKTKTGLLNNGVIYLKQGKNWIYGENMQKLGDNKYYAKTVYFTACDSEQYRTNKVIKPGKASFSERPDWCFRGEDAEIIAGDKVTAKNVTYRIKDVPVLYSPYMQAPAGNERKTGFLMPLVGRSSTKGVTAKESFFWAIDENMDATATVDYFSKRGFGEGLEYRFATPDHKGEWSAYHIRDTKLNQNFVAVKVDDRYDTKNLQAFLNVNYANRFDYFSEFGDTRQLSISRFLQSSAEVSAPTPLGNSRAYLLGQYWVNLRGDIHEHVAQKLPEVGYVLNPTALGPIVFSLATSGSNFVRKSDVHGQRFDIMPQLSHSIGDQIRLTQTAAFRATFYNLSEPGANSSTPHREMFEYRAQAQTRFMKRYDSFLHVIEPFVEYNYIPRATALPLFDATELPTKTSTVQAGVTSRFVFNFATLNFQLSQPYDTFASGDNAFMPTRLRGFLSGPASPLGFSFLTAYDSKNRRISNANSNITLKLFRDVTLGFGEIYSHDDHVLLLVPSASIALTRHLLLTASTSYDISAAQKLRDIALGLTYQEQCWNAKVLFTRKPSDGVRPVDYSFLLLIELRGVGGFKL